MERKIVSHELGDMVVLLVGVEGPLPVLGGLGPGLLGGLGPGLGGGAALLVTRGSRSVLFVGVQSILELEYPDTATIGCQLLDCSFRA